MKISDKVKNRMQNGWLGAIFILTGGLFRQESLKESSFIALVFFLICVGVPPLVTFMSHKNEVNS